MHERSANAAQTHETPGAPADGNGVWRTAELLRWIRGHLADRGVDSPRVCAELLLSSVFDCDRLRLYMEPDRPASIEERGRLRELVTRAARQEPVQHLVGEGWFFSRPFFVGPEVLVPRPATETLVAEAMTWLRGRPADTPVTALDLCTGSGCIAITLALDVRPPRRRSEMAAARLAASVAAAAEAEIDPGTEPPAGAETTEPIEARETAAKPPAGPEVELVATDLDAAAIETAQRNAERHAVRDRIEFRTGDLFEPIGDARFDLLCANPPYIDDARWDEIPANVRFEPEVALRGGPDGLSILRRIAEGAPRHLHPGGAILLEFQFDQAQAVRGLLETAGFDQVRIIADHEGHDRVAFGVRPD